MQLVLRDSCPAVTAADVGIAMCAKGATAASESADAVLAALRAVGGRREHPTHAVAE